MRSLLLVSALVLVRLSAQEIPPDQPAGERGWRKLNSDSGAQAQPPDPGPQSARNRAVPRDLVLPAGTWITVRVDTPLSSNHSTPGEAFTATLSQPLIVNGLVVARRGQTVGG